MNLGPVPSSLASVEQHQKRTMRKLPRSHWPAWSECVSQVSKRILTAHRASDDAKLEQEIRYLFKLPSKVLRKPKRGGQKGFRQIGARIRRAIAGENLEEDEDDSKRQSYGVSSRVSLGLKYIRAGHPGRAARMLTSAPVLRSSSNTYSKLQRLHPDCTSALPPGPSLVVPILFDE